MVIGKVDLEGEWNKKAGESLPVGLPLYDGRKVAKFLLKHEWRSSREGLSTTNSARSPLFMENMISNLHFFLLGVY